MSKEKWDNLSKTEKELWNKFTPQSKAIILGISKPTKPTLPPYQRKINLHDLSAHDYLSLIHEAQQHSIAPEIVESSNVESNNDCSMTNETPSDTTDSSNNLLAYITNQTPNQGDLRKVLSLYSSKKPDKKVTSPQTSTQNDDIIVWNGKRYRYINVLNINRACNCSEKGRLS